jgi:hypothetical protein
MSAADRPSEVQKYEPREEHRERADATLPLVVSRPRRPDPIRGAVVRRVVATREPPDKRIARDDAGSG